MKTKQLLPFAILCSVLTFSSCKDSEAEKIKDKIEIDAEKLEARSELLEKRSEDLNDAVDDLDRGFEDLEDAIKNFGKALETIENKEDRKIIRERVQKLVDSLEVTINK